MLGKGASMEVQVCVCVCVCEMERERESERERKCESRKGYVCVYWQKKMLYFALWVLFLFLSSNFIFDSPFLFLFQASKLHASFCLLSFFLIFDPSFCVTYCLLPFRLSFCCSNFIFFFCIWSLYPSSLLGSFVLPLLLYMNPSLI